jgi:COP9 signalosome complex subunit 4
MALKESEVRQAISNIDSAASAEKSESYKELQDHIFAAPDANSFSRNLVLYVESILSDSLSILQSRPLLTSFVTAFQQCKASEAKAEAGQQILELVAPRVASFEEQDLALKKSVADALEEEEDFKGAAKVLQSINLDSTQRNYSADEKAAQWLRIVRCYLEEDQPENAATFINRIKSVLPDVTDRSTQLMFSLCQARILDSQRSFLEASSKYYDVSLETIVAEDERLRALSQSIVCAVLAPAGPQRSVTLAKLYKDERTKLVEEYGIMEKIFFNRLLSPEEVKTFAEKLAPHQLARTSDGSTVLDKAVLEHNLLAASRLYRNIYTKQLGRLLGTDADKAEIYAAQMIEQGRLAGYIDQIEGLIVFDGEASGQKKVGHADIVLGKEQLRRDENIQALAERVESVASLIQSRYPVSIIRTS